MSSKLHPFFQDLLFPLFATLSRLVPWNFKHIVFLPLYLRRMAILVTGAGGFVGQELTSALLWATPTETRLVIVDVAGAPTLPASAQEHAFRVASIQADLTSPAQVDNLIKATEPYEVVYLLHGIMSSGSEANFDL